MNELLQLSKIEIVKIFNDELMIFLSELLKIFNEVNKKNKDSINKDNVNILISYKNLIETGIVVNKEIAIEMFSGYIFKKENEDFYQKISEKDYEYFIQNKDKLDKSNKFENLISIIKDLFVQLSETNKESIFGYLENLSTLSNIFVMKKISK